MQVMEYLKLSELSQTTGDIKQGEGCAHKQHNNTEIGHFG